MSDTLKPKTWSRWIGLRSLGFHTNIRAEVLRREIMETPQSLVKFSRGWEKEGVGSYYLADIGFCLGWWKILEVEGVMVVRHCECIYATVFFTCAFVMLSHVQLFVTLWTAAGQAPLSMGFSRQEYWSRLPFPSPGNKPTFPTSPYISRWLLCCWATWEAHRTLKNG